MLEQQREITVTNLSAHTLKIHIASQAKIFQSSSKTTQHQSSTIAGMVFVVIGWLITSNLGRGGVDWLYHPKTSPYKDL